MSSLWRPLIFQQLQAETPGRTRGCPGEVLSSVQPVLWNRRMPQKIDAIRMVGWRAGHKGIFIQGNFPTAPPFGSFSSGFNVSVRIQVLLLYLNKAIAPLSLQHPLKISRQRFCHIPPHHIQMPHFQPGNPNKRSVLQHGPSHRQTNTQETKKRQTKHTQ